MNIRIMQQQADGMSHIPSNKPITSNLNEQQGREFQHKATTFEIKTSIPQQSHGIYLNFNPGKKKKNLN